MPITQVAVFRRTRSESGSRLVSPSVFEIAEPFSLVEQSIRTIVAKLDGKHEVTSREDTCSVTVITETDHLKIDGFARALYKQVENEVAAAKSIRRSGDGSPDCVHDWQNSRDYHADSQ